eukprot:TRINITY_DN66115_c0_g1_i1.p1 TRINITY_DN66115_c0_g1~~TRINITY_DN66115_c0_g1_i1.p1  ORF type:complete len:407 (-),score=56.79 TRINITY_DN66115_c0_g1_i1:82-1302(-)
MLLSEEVSRSRRRKQHYAFVLLLALVGVLLTSSTAWSNLGAARHAPRSCRTHSPIALRAEAAALEAVEELLESDRPVEDRVFLITGSSDGLGKHTAKLLVERGCHVILHGRVDLDGDKEMELTDQARLLMLEFPSSKERLAIVQADLKSLLDVKTLANVIKERYDRLDGILHCAATIDGDLTGKRKMTFDDNEHTMNVNLMAPFVLTVGLWPLLKNAGKARVVFPTSYHFADKEYLDDLSCERMWTGNHAYLLSKLGLTMMTKGLEDHLGGQGVSFNAVYPGTYDTKLHRQGAVTGTGKRWGRGYKDAGRRTLGLAPKVHSCKALYEALIDDRYRDESGLVPESSPEVVYDKVARDKLMKEILQRCECQWEEREKDWIHTARDLFPALGPFDPLKTKEELFLKEAY